MALSRLITALEPRIRQIIRASDQNDIRTAVWLIKRELQDHHLETQNLFNGGDLLQQIKRPNIMQRIEICTFCKQLDIYLMNVYCDKDKF